MRWRDACSIGTKCLLDERAPDRSRQLDEIVQRVRDGRLLANIGRVSALDDAITALNAPGRRNGRTIVRIASQPTIPRRSTT
jgi:hypothetical protein